ncbi:MAG TPA: VTT domain-containing protein, partial [Candidatus Limnocylindria bacterium]|nr:VTT domain-containing protein [Candidatus Limnocylindria bacterium]
MKRYLLLLLGIAGLFLLLYALALLLDVPLLTDPGPLLARGGWGAALIGVGLLLADVALPVPASLVMAAHGALFGVPLGAALSLAGRAGGFALGYWLGRRSGGPARRFMREGDLLKAKAYLDRWGYTAIVATRPIPILSETASVAAGLSGLPFVPSLLAASAGSIPEALLYALMGAAAGGF